MTPKEKAWDLIRLYRNIDFENGENCHLFISTKDAKKCALIVVDEILNYQNQLLKNYKVELKNTFWEQVKQEIEAL